MSIRTGPGHGIAAWELLGILFIVIAGLLFHFIYLWTNQTLGFGIFFPVNESVWEHLKLGFWAVLLFSGIEYWFVGRGRPSFIVAKAAGLLSMQLFILAFFYGYHLFTGHSVLFFDISSYVLGAVLCQVVALLMLQRVESGKGAITASVCFLVLHGALLVAFTFTPPKLPLFMDAYTKTYGIQRSR